MTGATGTLLFHTLEELRSLAERTLPEIRLAYLSGIVTAPMTTATVSKTEPSPTSTA